MLLTDIIKHTMSLIENWETNDADGNEWYNQTKAATASYHEMYGNLQSNTFWVNYGQQATSANYYQETGQQYGPNYTENNEFSTCGQEQRPLRQDSLICFSMNFHANSIQVMTTPSSSNTGNQSDMSNTAEESQQTEHCQYVPSSEASQFNSPSEASIDTSHRSIKCNPSSNTSNLYIL